MSKLPRDARAFAQRVKMGAVGVWFVVEGRSTDRAFYDRILASHSLTESVGYVIRLGEQIELRGHSAGGKAHLYELHEFFASSNKLVQTSRSGSRRIGFGVDRDLAHLDGSMRRHPAIVYTASSDSESEVLINGDLTRAVCSAFSLDRRNADRVIPPGLDPVKTLADLWQGWIVVGTACAILDLPVLLRFRQASTFNSGTFGQEDPESVKAWTETTLASLPTELSSEDFERARLAAQAHFDADPKLLVKGKWVVRFVFHLVETGLSADLVEANVRANTVLKTCMETIDWSAAWADHYRNALDDLHLAA